MDGERSHHENVMAYESAQLKGERQFKLKSYKLANKYFTLAINVLDDLLNAASKSSIVLNDENHLKSCLAHSYCMRGQCLTHVKIFDLAVKDYSKAIILDKDNINAHLNRGMVYKLKGSYMHAEDDFTKVIDLSPRHGLAHFYRGNVRKCQNKIPEAFKDYEVALTLPDVPYALVYNNRGNLYLEEKKYTQAISDYSDALKLKPNFFVALRNRGILYKYQGQRDKSISDFTRAIQLSPTDVTSYNYRGIMYREKEMYELAIQDFSKSIELNPLYAAAFRNRSELYKKRNQNVLALRDISHAAQLQPDSDLYETERFQLVLKLRESCRLKSTFGTKQSQW